MTDIRGTRIVRLAQDPALSGDLLLLGMCLASVYDFGLQYENGLNGIGEILWPDSPHPHWRVRGVFKQDIRTYRPSLQEAHRRRCTAPMQRRDTACGTRCSNWAVVTDWATGEQTDVAACSRHRAWMEAVRAANFAEKPDIVPLPYANAGGLLCKHFPRIDWPKFWRQLHPKWVEHPERTARPKPDLTLVIGQGSKEGRRGSLSLVPVGGA
jgi:hypothetical protein